MVERALKGNLASILIVVKFFENHMKNGMKSASSTNKGSLCEDLDQVAQILTRCCAHEVNLSKIFGKMQRRLI